MAKTTGKDPDEFLYASLDIKEPPWELQWIWDVFLELANARGSNGFSLNPIGYVEIETWSRLYDIKFESWEIDVIRRLDLLALRTHNERERREADRRRNAAPGR